MHKTLQNVSVSVLRAFGKMLGWEFLTVPLTEIILGLPAPQLIQPNTVGHILCKMKEGRSTVDVHQPAFYVGARKKPLCWFYPNCVTDGDQDDDDDDDSSVIPLLYFPLIIINNWNEMKSENGRKIYKNVYE